MLQHSYAEPGSVGFLAMPIATRGHLPMRANGFYGVLPSLEAWR